MDKYISLITQGEQMFLQVLTEINWFAYKQNRKDEILERLTKQTDNKNFVTTLYHLWFDTEGFEDAAAYDSILIDIIKISGLTITSKNIVYDNKKKSIAIFLTTTISTYNYEIYINDDWIDEGFIGDFINDKVLVGENIESKFFALPLFDQTIQFVFVPQHIYNSAIERGIIPEQLNYFMTDADE